MQNQEIEILVHPDGSVEYTIKGVKGGACESISALLAQIGTVEHEERTSEFYEDGGEGHISIGAS